MCMVNRRQFFSTGAALAGTAAGLSEAAHAALHAEGVEHHHHHEEEIDFDHPEKYLDVNQVEKLADGVFFHEGDISKGHCNNGWIVFQDFVLVVDANFPSGAMEVLPKIRGLTDRPIRFAFDTHHHGDHAYGNQTWVENGAVPIAHTGVIDEMKKYETGHFGGKPGRWEETAQGRADVRASKLKPPVVTFPKEMYFDDGSMRVELIHLGPAHTYGDAVAWLPKQKILFTGDMCVNGAYNYTGDGDVEKWIKTLDLARKLGATVVGPGHGPKSTETLLDEQRLFFVSLRDAVGRTLQQNRTEEQLKAALPMLSQQLQQNKRIARYVSKGTLPGQVAKVVLEMTGQKVNLDSGAQQHVRLIHARDHNAKLRV